MQWYVSLSCPSLYPHLSLTCPFLPTPTPPPATATPGYFPVTIQALPEGTCVHSHVPVYQLTTTQEYAPLVTYLETLLTHVWYVCVCVYKHDVGCITHVFIATTCFLLSSHCHNSHTLLLHTHTTHTGTPAQSPPSAAGPVMSSNLPLSAVLKEGPGTPLSPVACMISGFVVVRAWNRVCLVAAHTC